MFLIEGYFDESGDLEIDDKIFCLSGYFIARQQAEEMHRRWVDVLQSYQVAYFHMVDCAHGNAGFQHLTKPERSQLVSDLIHLIKQYTIEGFSIFVEASGYQQSIDAPDAYSECASGCIGALQMFLRMGRIEGKIAYFFEKGHKSVRRQGSAYTYIAGKLRETDTVKFASKQEMPLLQAADLLAWQSTKYAKDYLYPKLRGRPLKRAPRKDFQSLMEHSHSFMYMDSRDGRKYMGIELWPLSKRSQFTINMTVDDSGPIVFLQEEGAQLPIIPVEKSAGYRLGGGQMVQVAFEGMGDRPFALMFDEPRLFEALANLLSATGAYANSKITPVLRVEGFTIEERDDKAMMRIKVQDSASIQLFFPADVFEKLKRALKVN